MSFASLERLTGNRRVTWYTLLGLILVPIAIGGLLLWSLYNPTERLHTATAAIVNNDQPVTIDGKATPLGRQLAAGLVHQSSTGKTKNDNYNWVITTKSDASSGLDDGTYQAVVTIPRGFSKAATSVQAPKQARSATINVQTSDHSGIAESAVGTTITRTASSIFGRAIGKSYLKNVYLGFNTLHSQLAKAEDGAAQLATGAAQAHEGANQLTSGTQTAQTGAHNLADGLGQLDTATGTLAIGAAQVSTGAAQVADGSSQLAAGLDTLSDGAAKTNTGAQQVAAGNGKLAAQTGQAVTKFDQLNAKLSTAPDLTAQTQQLATRAANSAQVAQQVADESTSTTQKLQQLAATCAASGASPTYCDQVATAASGSQTASTGAQQVAAMGTQVSAGAAQLAQVAPQLQAGVQQADTALHQLNAATTQLADGSAQVADGTSQLASGSATAASSAHTLADGAAQVSSGAGELSSGAATLHSKTGTAREGAVSLADGIDQLADGANQLADGTSSLSSGATSLHHGLSNAVDQVPTYSKSDRTRLADTVTQPVTVNGASLTDLFSGSAMPFLASIALWIGALALFLILRPLTRAALTSSASLTRIMARTGLPAVTIGAIQGFLVACIGQIALRLDVAAWFGFAGIAILAAVTFTLVLQGATALLGGTGRFLAVLAGALAIGASIFSTAPGLIRDIASALPTSAATNALTAPVSGSATVAISGIVALLVWSLIGLALTAVAVSRRRSVTANAIVTGRFLQET